MVQSNINFKKNVLLNILLFLVGIGTGGLLFSVFLNNQEKNIEAGNEISISQSTYNNLEELKRLVDYAIERYCSETGKENTYTYQIIDNMMHHDTRISARTTRKEGYVFDLDKIVPSGLAYNKFTFEIQGEGDTIYVIINTYRMKMYVYDDNPYIVDGEAIERDIFDSEVEAVVQSDWLDMWSEEYDQFVDEDCPYLLIPDFDEKVRMNPPLYGMVIYGLQRYCEENGIEELFSFSYPDDRVGWITQRIITVKVESENRILYMDIDMDRNKMHIYQVHEDRE